MPRIAIDKETRKKILVARQMIQAAEKADCNEAETRRRIEKIFENVLGYDVLKHLSREYAVRGAGETEHVDYAVQLGEGDKAKPEIMIEIKRISIDLARKHLKQVSSYAINAGCEWLLLTNGKEWQLHHVSFGQPPETKMIHAWNILTDDIYQIAEKFNMISYKSIKAGKLSELWQKTNVLHPRNLLQAILSVSSLASIRKEIRKDSGVLLPPEDIMSGIRRLLNETALTELENVHISLPDQKLRKRKRKTEIQEHTESSDLSEPSQTESPKQEH